VRDTTGAGDAFAAAVVSSFLRTSASPRTVDWWSAVTLGCAAAALKIQHLGARNGLPTRSVLSQFMGDLPTCNQSSSA
jgi:sugar/nucleoside kinase (ribokinase family)